MARSGEHRAYVVETHLQNAESVIATQRLVRTHFRLGRNATVPDRKTKLLWVAYFRATGSALKKQTPGRPRSVRSPQNVQAVRQAITQSPRRSDRKHAAAMGMLQRSVRRILHADLKSCILTK
jgi:transposase